MNLRALVDNKDKLVLPNIPLPPPPSTKTPSPNLARLSPFLRSLIIARQQNVLDRGVLEEGRTRCRRALCWLIHFPSFTIKTTSRMKRADSSGVVFCVKIQRWRAEAVENFLLFGARRKDNAEENVVRETKGLGKLEGGDGGFCGFEKWWFLIRLR